MPTAPHRATSSSDVDGSFAVRLRRLVASVVLLPVWLWRATGPLRQPRCRFHPSCSTYAVEAVRTHGSARGGMLAVRRLGRCHPWNPGGIDPVPPRDGTDPAVGDDGKSYPLNGA